eukprot:CAMPEP_0206458020 /NCGR_PEP_ID=MMETSP0324_2-20121206/23312_1 /ASSEMBLY_ACC=CAM_ASM_000836 /TAXON_ID=2866 /ORGANISM="Crypthecodinium cohnii, Strain Seligo" /LENGTH=455 /DNA_ID=CAMNT_0053929261 /DNA_START=75 /DNA_END=1442 /DNA_ORIENTATION=+
MATEAMTDVQKRKLDEDEAESRKKAAADGPKAMEVDSGMMKNEDFSRDLLRVYYDRLFPYLQMFRWLSYKNDPKSSTPGVQKDFFLRREFTFVLEGDIFCRYLCFRDAEELRSQITQRQPIRMEIGAVYTHPPKTHTTVMKDAYRPLERELVFDIDMDEYDDIRSCCTGARLCLKCCTFLKAALRVLQHTLKNHFGFKHMLFVYSGRRGMHCWVCDSSARKLSNEHRAALAKYLTLVAGGQGKCQADIKMSGEELHPFVSDAHRLCLEYFRDDPQGVLQGQDLLRKGPHLTNILSTLTVVEQEKISKYLEEHPKATSADVWANLESLGKERAGQAVAGNYKMKQASKSFLKDVVLQYTAPRLDVEVSKQMNHLLKSPFAVHPKTGQVCVPLDPDKIDSFDPSKVPTLGRLVDELNSGVDPRNTSLREYTHFFEEGFLKPLEKDSLEELTRGNVDW